MHTDLLAPYDALERRTRNLLSQLAALSEAQRCFRPAPGSWCLLEVADHLAITEATVVRGIERGLPEGKDRRRLRDRLAYPLLRGLLRLPIRVKAPLPVLVPQEIRPLEEVEASWREARAALAEHVEALDAAALERPFIRHPVAGPLGPRDTLVFLSSHFDHHLFQVRRIREHADFPAAEDTGGGALD